MKGFIVESIAANSIPIRSRVLKDRLVNPTSKQLHLVEVLYFADFVDGKKPQAPEGYIEDTKCIWEYDILGLWSMGGREGDG